MNKDFVLRHAQPVPRYTSYPTAPHFHDGVKAHQHADWLKSIRPGEDLSLYAHIPFCDSLCWFCGCHTKQTRQYAPVAAYLKSLHCEIETVRSFTGKRGVVRHVHLGGGSPTMLTPADLKALLDGMRAAFSFAEDAEIAIEIDPRDLDEARLDGLVAAGLTRASIGVQDFDPVVQKAINRMQSYEMTRDAVAGLRARGVSSVNLDVVYGLPYQTRDRLTDTIEKVVSIRPDRIALFGYAHVPWMKKHQTMIDEQALPDTLERFAEANRAASMLTAAGYQRIGMDHFALPGDSMAIAAENGALRRNFQGYTTDDATLIGFGASAISSLRQGYIQNITATGVYRDTVERGELATARGFELSYDDRIRRRVIELLMCDFRFTRSGLLAEFGDRVLPVLEDAEYLAAADADDMFESDGDTFYVTGKGAPFVRSIASAFDSYFGQGAARHSAAV